MKKMLVLIVAIFLPMLVAVASPVDPVAVHTSCGKTVYLERGDYESAEELLDAAIAVDEAVCKRKSAKIEKDPSDR